MATAIPELQAVFGTILQLRKSKPGARTPTETYPKWTGAFRLFDFPRELRDRIYLYALYKPQGYIYTRNRAHIKDPWKEKDETHINLYLTSRQIYAEALEAFCRYNALSINYTSRIAGTLRLFPERPAQFLQRIRLTYYQGRWHSDWPRRTPSGCFAQMMIDSHVAKSFFPLLRECTAVWLGVAWALEHEEHLSLSHPTQSESVRMLLDWMQRFYRIDRLVPPSHLRVELGQLYHPLEGLEKAFAEALEEFKLWAREEDKECPDPEAEGRRWIEEAFALVPPKRDRRKRGLLGHR